MVMLSDAQRQHITLAARTMQIIVGALCAGVLFFAAIVLLLISRNGAGGPADTPIITYVAVLFVGGVFLAWALVPGIIADRLRQSIVARQTSPFTTMPMPNADELGDVLPLTVAYQTRLIVGAAMLEGAAFFCLVAYLIERQQLSLILAGALLLTLLSQIPTVGRLEAWVDRELASIEQLRQMRSIDDR